MRLAHARYRATIQPLHEPFVLCRMPISLFRNTELTREKYLTVNLPAVRQFFLLFRSYCIACCECECGNKQLQQENIWNKKNCVLRSTSKRINTKKYKKKFSTQGKKSEYYSTFWALHGIEDENHFVGLTNKRRKLRKAEASGEVALFVATIEFFWKKKKTSSIFFSIHTQNWIPSANLSHFLAIFLTKSKLIIKRINKIHSLKSVRSK